MVYVDRLKERYPNTSDYVHVLHVLNMSFLHACGVLHAVKFKKDMEFLGLDIFEGLHSAN